LSSVGNYVTFALMPNTCSGNHRVSSYRMGAGSSFLSLYNFLYPRYFRLGLIMLLSTFSAFALRVR